MATQTEKDAIKAKLDEASALVDALPDVQAQLDAANTTITQLNAKIDAAKAAAQADKDADAASTAGQGVLDALA